MNLKLILNAARRGQEGVWNCIESEILEAAQEMSKGMYRDWAIFDAQMMEDILHFSEQNKERKDLVEAASIIQKTYDERGLQIVSLELKHVGRKLADRKISIFNRDIDDVLSRSKKCFNDILNKKEAFDEELVQATKKNFTNFGLVVLAAITEETMQGNDSSGLKELRGNNLYQKINSIPYKSQEDKSNDNFMC